MKPILKYVDLGRYCSIATGRDRDIERYYGTANIRLIRPATADDVLMVKAMGGYIPEGTLLERRRRRVAGSPRPEQDQAG